MLRSLTRWIDRDWERHRYFSLFAIGQRLLWVAPVLIAAGLVTVAEALGAKSNGSLSLGLLIVGLFGSLLMFSLSMYRWFIGYSRTEWQEEQAAQRRNEQL